jgi:hypothetical protein
MMGFLAAVSLLLSMGPLAPSPQQTTARDFLLERQAEWAEHLPTDFQPRYWKRFQLIPWTALLGEQAVGLPQLEEVAWIPSRKTGDAAKVLRLHRDFLTFDLGFQTSDRLLWVEVHENQERGVRGQRLKLDPTRSLAAQWPKPVPPTNPFPPAQLAVQRSELKDPRECYQDLLEQFRSADLIHFDATAVLKIAQQDQATEVGQIQMQMTFMRPGFGSLSMKGWIGADKRKVHSQILGTTEGMLHVDHLKKTALRGGGFDAIAEGMLGFEPLAVWSGMEAERPVEVRMLAVPGHDFGWTGLQVETQQLITVYRFDPQNRLVGAAVVPKDPGGTRQIMEYRFHGLELPKEGDRKRYQLSSPYPLDAEQSQSKADGMLPIGASLPEGLPPHTNSVLFLWLDSGPQQQQDLAQLRRHWREIERKHKSVKLVRIPASDTTATQALQVRYFPSFYVIDADGKVSERFIGWDQARLQRAVRRLADGSK